MTGSENIFKRNRTLVFFLIGLVIVLALLYILRSAILPFVIGIVLVYLLLPAITWVEKKLPYKGKGLEAKRIFLIILSFIVVLALVSLLVYLIVTVVADSFSALISSAPEYITQGLNTLQEWFESFRQILSSGQRQQVDEAISEIALKLSTWLQNAVVSGLAFIPETFSMLFGFFALPLFLFYILKDSRKLSESFYSFFSLGFKLLNPLFVGLLLRFNIET